VFQNLKTIIYSKEFQFKKERITISCIKISKIDREGLALKIMKRRVEQFSF